MSPGVAVLRDADDLLAPAVEAAIAALEPTDSDTAAVQLARRYAAVIDGCEDQAWAMRWIAPGLLDVLEQLGATPAARARLKKGAANAEEDPLTRLRARRRGA